MKNHGDRPRWSNYNEINLSFTVASIPGLLNQRQMDHRYTRARFGSILKRKSFALAFCLVSSPHQYFEFLPCLSKCAHCLFFWRNNSNDDSIEQLAFLHSRMKSNISFRLQFDTIFFNPKVMIFWLKIVIYSLEEIFKIETLIEIYIYIPLGRTNFKRIEDHSCSWKGENERWLLFLAIIRAISRAQPPVPSSIRLKTRREPPSKIDATREDRSNDFLSRQENPPWRFKTLCKSRWKRSSSSFLLIVGVQRKMRRASREVGETWPRTMPYLPSIGDRQWRKRIREVGMKRVNRTCCFPFASKKSSRMNGIVSPRGNCERSHWSRSIILRYIFVGSVDTRSEREEEGEGSSRAKRLDVADKLSSLRHRDPSRRDILPFDFRSFLQSLG